MSTPEEVDLRGQSSSRTKQLAETVDLDLERGRLCTGCSKSRGGLCAACEKVVKRELERIGLLKDM